MRAGVGRRLRPARAENERPSLSEHGAATYDEAAGGRAEAVPEPAERYPTHHAACCVEPVDPAAWRRVLGLGRLGDRGEPDVAGEGVQLVRGSAGVFVQAVSRWS